MKSKTAAFLALLALCIPSFAASPLQIGLGIPRHCTFQLVSTNTPVIGLCLNLPGSENPSVAGLDLGLCSVADTFSGIRVNAIAPGFLLTNQNRTLLTNPDGSLTDRSHKILGHTPYGRFLQPDELVGALHYLASDASKGVTGTIAVVDGGFNCFTI